jgi:hypothetical protein
MRAFGWWRRKLRRSSKVASVVPVVALFLAGLCAALAHGEPPLPVPIVFHVAQSSEHRAQVEPFIESQLEHANLAFAPTGVGFVDAGRAKLSPAQAVLVTRADRDALLAQVAQGAVHCMVVARLMDVDEPGRERRGVHWYRAGTSRPHMVIVSTLAGEYVLAHELGHFFGNPAHSQEPGNLMSYLPGVLPPVLTEAQQRRVRQSLVRMQRRGELPLRVRARTP